MWALVSTVLTHKHTQLHPLLRGGHIFPWTWTQTSAWTHFSVCRHPHTGREQHKPHRWPLWAEKKALAPCSILFITLHNKLTQPVVPAAQWPFLQPAPQHGPHLVSVAHVWAKLDTSAQIAEQHPLIFQRSSGSYEYLSCSQTHRGVQRKDAGRCSKGSQHQKEHEAEVSSGWV